jgi:hypothetical protein
VGDASDAECSSSSSSTGGNGVAPRWKDNRRGPRTGARLPGAGAHVARS